MSSAFVFDRSLLSPAAFSESVLWKIQRDCIKTYVVMQPLFGAFECLKCKLLRISALCRLSLNPDGNAADWAL